jgi:uncharacterized protein YcfJ
MNSKILAGFTTLALGLATAAQAGNHYGRDAIYRDAYRGQDNRGYARVLQVEPLVERVRYAVPVDHCWDEERVSSGYRKDPTGAIVGGALGAVVGNHVGHGNGRGLATLAGALVGGAIGNDVAGDRRYRETRVDVVQRCETRQETRWDERVVAYRVTYVYNGRRDVTRLPYDPGRSFRVDDARRYD